MKELEDDFWHYISYKGQRWMSEREKVVAFFSVNISVYIINSHP